MIKKYLLLLGVLTCTSLVYAQQDMNFTVGQYQNLSYQNPAFLGSHDAYCATLLGRMQWTGFEGGPETFVFSAEAPVAVFGGGANHGVGLTVMSDAIGPENTMVVKMGYNYKFSNLFAGGDLRVGFGLGYIQKTLGSDWKAIDGDENDPNIPVGGASEGGLDMDFGLFYKIPDKLSIGISSTHLTGTEFSSKLDDLIKNQTRYRQFKYRIDRTIYVSAQYETALNENWDIKPGLFIKTDLAATSFDVGAIAEYQERFWGGLNYRWDDAIALMLGANFQMNGENMAGGMLRVGYSYDYTLTSMGKHNNGGHEIFARYCFNINLAPPPTRHRTVIFL